MATLITEKSSNKCFGGLQKTFTHDSDELKCKMNFAVFLPPKAVAKQKVPVLYYLSGLTCTEANVVQKSGFQRKAADLGIMVVCPDTSPRGCNIEGEDESYDFGTGAGFYVDATTEKYSNNYRMYSYVTKELPKVIESNFSVTTKRGITGHSMGGHGALICYLKNPGFYVSCSAFSPIVNPIKCPWGQKAFKGYLGNDEKSWESYDACCLLKGFTGERSEVLVDQGSSDDFLAVQLLSNNLIESAKAHNFPVTLRFQEGYDHSYFFIASLMADHLDHHASLLL